MDTVTDVVMPVASRDESQDGVITILSAITTMIVLLSLALAVDIGSLVLADRDLQGAVDIAALDAVRALGDLTTGDAVGQADALAQASLAQNPGWSGKDGRTMTTTVGTYDEMTRRFTATSVAPDAVLVEARASLARLTGVVGGRDELVQRAVARNEGAASVSIGTSVASIDSDRSVILNRVLSRMFGRSSDLTLDVASYKGLAAGTVSLRRLSADLGLASPAELVDTTVSVRRLLEVAASGLSSSGDPLDLGASGPMTTISSQVGGTLDVTIGDLLDLETGAAGALVDVEVNALSLVTVAAQVVNGDRVVDLGMPIAIPGVGSGTITLSTLETPRIGVGRAGRDANTGDWRTVATTAQLRVGINLTAVDLGDLGPVTVGPLHVPLVVEAGRGEAPLERIVCATATPEPSVLSPVTTGAVVTTVGAIPPALGAGSMPIPAIPADLATVSVQLPLLGAVNLGVLSGVGQHVVGGNTSPLTFVGPYQQSQRTSGSSTLGGTPRVPASSGDGRVGLAYAVDSSTLGLSLSGSVGSSLDLYRDVYDPVLGALTPILDAVDARIVGPLVQSLGVSLGAADVTVADVDCGMRMLVQ